MLNFFVDNTERETAGISSAISFFLPVVIGLLVMLHADKIVAGALSGPVFDFSVAVEVEDFIQLPASAGSRPFARINQFRQPPDGTNRYFINDLRGVLHVVENGSVQTYLDMQVLRPALKTSPGLAAGFVSFAFHPDFSNNGLFYTVHTETPGATVPTMQPPLPITVDQHSIVTEWQAANPASSIFSGTSRELIRVASPHRFHNLGELAFNPYASAGDTDYGLLYITAGDFASVVLGQPGQLQRLDSPYGTVMRIDPLGGNGSAYSYGIPAHNPYVSSTDPTVLKEIIAHGFRNPHRLAWLANAGGALLVSDIGESNFEEINLLVDGGNYGWPYREGNYALDPVVDPSVVFALPANDASFGYSYPAVQYDHEEGAAIAGAYAFENAVNHVFSGKILLGDIATGRLFFADLSEVLAVDISDPATTASLTELTLVHEGMSSTVLDLVRDALGLPGLGRADLRIAQDRLGDLYLMTKQDGFVRRLSPAFEVNVPVLMPVLQFGLALILLLVASLVRRRAAQGKHRAS